MKIKLLDSIYNVEPKSTIMGWEGHWNYQWSGRKSSGINKDDIKWRKESESEYVVCDKDGSIWLMDRAELDLLLAA